MFHRQTLALLRQAALVILLSLGGGAARPGDAVSENQLKAAYLVNFLKYVEWPASRGPLTLCLFGRDSLGPQLAAYEGRTVAGRELRIRRVSSPEQVAECEAIFVPETEEARFGAVLRWVDKLPVLTVSDSEFFTREGGSIALIRSEGRLQFDVNLDALSRAGLKAGSPMLRLARHVFGGHR